MKKIFAFVLATIMVLSLVPASAFAAITKADCSNGHKDPVKIGGQAATCQSSGYTIYKCNECGESYVADPVEKLEHNWVSDKTKAHLDVKASCLYETDGYQYVVCGNKGCTAEDVLVVHWNSVEAHNLQKVSGMGCETLWSCKTCGAEGHKAPVEFVFEGETYECVALSDEPAHSWKFEKVTAEPSWGNGKSTDGLALYLCEAEGCPAQKTVVIACPDCECADLVIVKPAVAQTCTTDGTLAVYQCVACAALWFDSNNDNDATKVGENDLYLPVVNEDNPATDDDINDDGVITVEDAIIEKDGHKLPLATQVTQTGCVRSYTCEVCKVAVVETYHANVVPNVVLEPNCVRYGIRYDVCQLCGNQETVYIEALGHKEAYVTVASTCAIAGGKYIVCTEDEDKCPLATTTINGVTAQFVTCETAYPLNSSAHSLINQMTGNSSSSTVDCFTSGINVWTCANGCAKYATPVVEYKAQRKHDLIKQVTVTNCIRGKSGVLGTWTTMTFYQCKQSGCTYKEFDTTTKGPNAAFELEYKDIETSAITTIQTTFADTAEMLEYHGVLRRGWQWKSNKVQRDTSKDTYRCYSASTWLGEDATTCAFTRVPSLDKPATCLEAGYTVYRCTSCNMLAYVTEKKLDHNHDLPDGVTLDQLFIEGTPATCNTPGIRDSYKCYWCGTQYHNQQKLKDHAIVYDTQSTNLVIKPCGNYDTLRVVENCKEADYVECSICNTIYEKIDCATKRNPNKNDHTWKDIAVATPATCGNDGTIEVRYCTTCNKVQANLVYVIEGETVRVTKTGSKKWDSAKNTFNFTVADGLAYAVKVEVAKKGTTATFTYEKNVTNYCPAVVKMLNHTTRGSAVEGDAIVVDDTHASTTVLDHSEATFVKYQCSLCDYEIIKNYAPAAAGHVNADGQVLTVDCENANAVSDRLCVICYKATGDKAASTIATGHNMVPATDKTAADWDCTNAGFSYEVCTKCGAFEVGDTVIPADAKAYHEKLLANPGFNLYVAKTIKAVGPLADYAHDGAYYYACATCGAQLTEYEEEDCPGVGVEFTLDADYASYSFGSSIFVTVNIDSLKGVEVWGLNFQVGYSDNVKFIGFKTIDASGFTGTAHSPVEAYLEDNGTISYKSSGVVNVALSNANGIIVKGESSVIVLEFQVIKNAEGRKMAADFTIGNLDDGTSVLSAVVVGANRKNIACMYNDVASERVEVKAFADLDGDNATTMFDAFDLYYLILNDGYNVVADIDKNGLVNVDDLNILYDFIIGKIGADDILNPKEEEEKERVIEKDAEGNVIYDSLCDFNENGKIDTVSELAALSGRIDPNLFW